MDVDAVYRNYFRLVYKVCWNWTKNEADAEELTQDTFLWVHRYHRHYDPEKASLASWLCQAAKQVCYNRSQRYEAKLAKASDGLDVLFERRSEDCDVRRSFDAKQALARLPRKLRETAILHAFGHELKEIGQMNGISQSGAFRLLEKARTKMEPICN